jgi:uncharacterized protein (TIGR02145 family)
MSISQQLSQLARNVGALTADTNAIFEALRAKGVAVPANAQLSDVADMIESIEVPITSVEIGGRSYPVVRIGNQLWMAENLNYKYPGMHFEDNEYNYGYGAYYNYHGTKCYDYGLLYNNIAMNEMNSHGYLPTGWRFPTIEDWNTLINYIGGASNPLKLKSTSGWTPVSWNHNGTDDFGFNAKPAGRKSGSSYNVGNFENRGLGAYFWTAYNTYQSTPYIIMEGDGDITQSSAMYREMSSIRLVKDVT